MQTIIQKLSTRLERLENPKQCATNINTNIVEHSPNTVGDANLSSTFNDQCKVIHDQ